jgi:hypothetical protein
MHAPALTRDVMGWRDPTNIPVYFSMVVWGDAFVSFFLEFCLPSLLAPKNIPCVQHRARSKFILHTPAADLPAIERSPAFALLKETIEVDIRLLHFQGLTPHEELSRCHRETMTLADASGVPVIFLSPDTIWSDGSIATVDQLLSSGKRVIFLSSLRLVKENAEPVVRELFGSRESVELSVDARQLNKIALQYLHPTMEEYFFESERGERLSPMALFWSAPNGDVLVHAFHQHPLLVYPKRRFANFTQTIDGDLVKVACPDPHDHHIVQDSDEITAIELSKRSQFVEGLFDKGDSQAVAAWALGHANRVHWRLFPTPVRMHAHPIDDGAWSAVEREAAAVIERILGYRRSRILIVLCKDALYWVIKKTLGMSRSQAQEWLFRRQHAIKFNIRNSTYRRWHAVRSFCRSSAYLALSGPLFTKLRKWGAERLIARSGLLDSDWYLKNYPDVAEQGVDPIRHYLALGANEGRHPSPYFSGTAYLERHPDVAASGMNPLLHFVVHGRKEGRSAPAATELCAKPE